MRADSIFILGPYFLRILGSLLAPFWLHFGALWGHFGLHLGSLGSLWAPFGLFWEAFGVRWASVGSFLDVQRAKRMARRVSPVIFMLYSMILCVFCNGFHNWERGRGCAAGAAEDHLTCNAVFETYYRASPELIFSC